MENVQIAETEYPSHNFIMNIYHIMSYSIILLACCACTSGRQDNTAGEAEVSIIDFPETQDTTWNYLTSGDAVPYPSSMIVTDSSLYVHGINHNKWLHEFDRETGEYKGSHIRRGNVVGCIMSAGNITYDYPSGTFSLFDIGLGARDLTDYSDKYRFISHFLPDSSITANAIIRAGKDRAIVESPRRENNKFCHRSMLQLYDTSDNKLLYTFDDPTFSDTPYGVQRLKYGVSPTQSRFATVAPGTWRLEFFEVTATDSIVRIFSKEYHPTEYVETEDLPPMPDSHYSFGFKQVAASEDYVFVTFTDSREENAPVNSIGIWKWDGTPVKRINTDRSIMAIAPSPDGKRLYGSTFMDGAGYFLLYLDL